MEVQGHPMPTDDPWAWHSVPSLLHSSAAFSRSSSWQPVSWSPTMKPPSLEQTLLTVPGGPLYPRRTGASAAPGREFMFPACTCWATGSQGPGGASHTSLAVLGNSRRPVNRTGTFHCQSRKTGPPSSIRGAVPPPSMQNTFLKKSPSSSPINWEVTSNSQDCLGVKHPSIVASIEPGSWHTFNQHM